MVYAPMPKNPMCPTDSSPVKPTTRFRLTARIAQIANTVPTVIAKPVPSHAMNTQSPSVMTSRLAHSSMLPRASRVTRPGAGASAAASASVCADIATLSSSAAGPWARTTGRG